LSAIYEDHTISSIDRSISICTDGRGRDYQFPVGAANCLGNFTTTATGNYQVTVRRNNI
jgi:hypothetical protein